YDEEKSLGLGEVGGDTALPIWVEYMKVAHEDLPAQDFSVPPGIVFANIDGQTGNLASASSSSVVRQAFIEGTEPKTLSGSPSSVDDTEFLKKDLTE
ncbi:MAG: penicillin-binding protein 1A, partial [Bdellovibrionota bacterium]